MELYRIPSRSPETGLDQVDEVSKYLDGLHLTRKIRAYSIDRFGEDLHMYFDLTDPASEQEITRTFRQYGGDPIPMTRQPVAISGAIKSVESEMMIEFEEGVVEGVVIHRSKVASS